MKNQIYDFLNFLEMISRRIYNGGKSNGSMMITSETDVRSFALPSGEAKDAAPDDTASTVE